MKSINWEQNNYTLTCDEGFKITLHTMIQNKKEQTIACLFNPDGSINYIGDRYFAATIANQKMGYM